LAQPIGPRFWSKVHKTPSCWLWTSSRIKNWHGTFSVHGYPRYAHRVAWELANGPIPDGLQVLHRCDEPICVRPDHLFLGTQADNLKDAAKKERFHVPRPNHHRRTLSDTDVERIKMLRASGLTLEAIGAEFGVTKSAVCQIVNGKRRVYTAPQLRQPQKKAG
jgi:hypothetical protein